MVLQGKKILIGITGSIAAYKTILLTRELVKSGAEVKVVMTQAAKDFVSPLVLSTLSKNEVLHQIAEGDSWSNHVMLGRWADIMAIAPASCNTIAKMAAGICDNLLLAVYLSATCPVMVAPAMDEDMWNHPSTKRNLETLHSYGNKLLSVGKGELASGLVGEGRMAEPSEIVEALVMHFRQDVFPLSGIKAMVTAGPTFEPIDPVRFIGNHSTGLMGIEIASALYKAGAEVTLILGPSHLSVPAELHLIRVNTAVEMFEAAKNAFSTAQIAVMTAAVADYRPSVAAKEKIKKSEDSLSIHLIPNPDILHYCGHHKSNAQTVVGFALETEQEEVNAQKKLVAKKADMIVLNSLRDDNSGFGTPTNKIAIFESNGQHHEFPLMSKAEVAQIIVEKIIAQRENRYV